MTRLPRIAFVIQKANAVTDSLIRGMSRAADSASVTFPRFTLRVFEIGVEARATLPMVLETWSPDVAIAWLPDYQHQLLSAISQARTPVISNTRRPARRNEPVVVVDSSSVFQAVHRHLGSIGVDRVWQFSMNEASATLLDRDYRDYCERHGVERLGFTCDEVPDASDYFQPETNLSIPKSLQRWLESIPKPAGVFTQHEYCGPYLCRACKQLGIRVPEDLAIIGMDGFDVSLWCDPPLTSLHVPFVEVGRESARLALEIIAGRPCPAEQFNVGKAGIIPRGSTTTAHLKGVDIRAAVDMIERHACEGINVQDVVGLTQNVSRQTFGKHFKQWTGMTPAEAIRRRKIAEAKRILRDTDMPITTLSQVCGFSDDVVFRKVFSKAEACSPTAYRKSQQLPRLP